MEIGKALINDRLRVSKVSSNVFLFLLKKEPTFQQFLLSFLFIKKNLGLNNLKIRKAMNANISDFSLLFVLKRSYFCYYIIWSNKALATSSPAHLFAIRGKPRGCSFRTCSHFADTCVSETIFVANRLRVQIAIMLSATQIGTIPLRSKKWSETILEYFPHSVNNMKRNKEARKVKFFL